MKNIYITGAQSTGKTTIVDALEEIFCSCSNAIACENETTKPIIIREVARNVLRTYNFTRDDITSSASRALQLQQHILKAQFEAEESASCQSPSSWYITDRSGMDPIVYASVFVGQAAAQELLASAQWHELERRMKEGIVFLCEAGTRWLVDDGTRLMPNNEEQWMEMDQTFRQLLEARQIDYIVIPKQLYEIGGRVRLVTETISRMKGGIALI
ncbi:MAG: hypothetical protein LQ340_005278 [Diploschistes diacapsis]|nr:MAG: hypothetical protein LQ340_005278 [Diploschistes diacapsis]